LSKIAGLVQEEKIPILMYHSISDKYINSPYPYFWVNTSPERFKEQLRFLSENDYSVISLDKMCNASEEGEKGKKPVVITFDDGYHTVYTSAFPLMQKYGFNATVFLVPGIMGSKSKFSERYLKWNEIQEMQKNGMKFGSHTVNHVRLDQLKKEEIEYQLKKSKEMIENELGERITSFSYPFAFPEGDKSFVSFLKGLLQESGYESCVSTNIGRNSRRNDLYFLRRIPINSRDDAYFFRAKLNGAYDWLHYFQFAAKKIKSRSHGRGDISGRFGLSH
jgi:peptidoglycan/xylan/chitin deacetylase (PgdA/CDA1 family)